MDTAVALVFVGNDCLSTDVRHFVCQRQDQVMDEKISRYGSMGGLILNYRLDRSEKWKTSE